jgi:hypothetical protein
VVPKPTEWEPSTTVVLPPPSAGAAEPSFSTATTQAGSGLVACDYADARAFAQRMLRFLARMKNVVDD